MSLLLSDVSRPQQDVPPAPAGRSWRNAIIGLFLVGCDLIYTF